MVSAFRRARARAVHPDTNTGGGDPERVALLVRARSTLTGAEREAYEGSLRAHRAKRAIEADRERREARQREREEVRAEAKRVLKQGLERARYRRARLPAIRHHGCRRQPGDGEPGRDVAGNLPKPSIDRASMLACVALRAATSSGWALSDPEAILSVAERYLAWLMQRVA